MNFKQVSRGSSLTEGCLGCSNVHKSTSGWRKNFENIGIRSFPHPIWPLLIPKCLIFVLELKIIKGAAIFHYENIKEFVNQRFYAKLDYRNRNNNYYKKLKFNGICW